MNTSTELKDNLERRYQIMAQYDSPRWNYLKRFCNATDGLGEKTYILDKIIAGFVEVWRHRCITIRDFSPNKDYGWDWQVLYIAFSYKIIPTTFIKLYIMWSNKCLLTRHVLKW